MLHWYFSFIKPYVCLDSLDFVDDYFSMKIIYHLQNGKKGGNVFTLVSFFIILLSIFPFWSISFP